MKNFVLLLTVLVFLVHVPALHSAKPLDSVSSLVSTSALASVVTTTITAPAQVVNFWWDNHKELIPSFQLDKARDLKRLELLMILIEPKVQKVLIIDARGKKHFIVLNLAEMFLPSLKSRCNANRDSVVTSEEIYTALLEQKRKFLARDSRRIIVK